MEKEELAYVKYKDTSVNKEAVKDMKYEDLQVYAKYPGYDIDEMAKTLGIKIPKKKSEPSS